MLYILHDHEEKLACIENQHTTTAEEDQSTQITGDITELLNYPALKPPYFPSFLLCTIINRPYCVS